MSTFEKTPLSFEQLCWLAELARAHGKAHLFMDIALQWAGAAEQFAHEITTWRSLDSAPTDGTYVLLAGPSGYKSTPLRVEVCKYVADPQQPHGHVWWNHAGDSFTETGAEPLFWTPLLNLPQDITVPPIQFED